MSKDPWMGDLRRPQSLSGFSYVEGNPVNWTDPSGLIGCIGGGNMAVMEFDNCVTGGHGGISSGQPIGGGVVPVAIAVGVGIALGRTAASIYHQLPGFDLLPPQGGYDYTTPGIIQPCFSPPGTNIMPHPFWLPGYGAGNSPYYGTGMIGTPLLPPGALPDTYSSVGLDKNWELVSVHTERSTKRGGRQSGVSIQEIYENVVTGERKVRHIVLDDKGKVVEDHWRRDIYKPREGE